MEASLVCCMHWKQHQKEVRSGGREGTGISEKKDCVFATELWYYASLITYNKTLVCYNPFSYFLSVKQWFTKTWSWAAAFSSPPQCPISIILLFLYRECCFLPSDVLQEDTCQVTSTPFHTAVWDLVSRLHLNQSVILGQALDTKLCWQSAAAKVCVTLRPGVCPAAGLELQSCFLLRAEDAFTYLGAGGGLTVVHKSICSLCSHIYNLLYRSSCGSPDGAPLLRVLCCTVLFTPPWHLGQGICANR